MITKGELAAVKKTLNRKWLPKLKATTIHEILLAGAGCALCEYHEVESVGKTCEKCCVLHDEGTMCCKEYSAYFDAFTFAERIEAAKAMVRRLRSIIRENTRGDSNVD